MHIVCALNAHRLGLGSSGSKDYNILHILITYTYGWQCWVLSGILEYTQSDSFNMNNNYVLTFFILKVEKMMKKKSTRASAAAKRNAKLSAKEKSQQFDTVSINWSAFFFSFRTWRKGRVWNVQQIHWSSYAKVEDSVYNTLNALSLNVKLCDDESNHTHTHTHHTQFRLGFALRYIISVTFAFIWNIVRNDATAWAVHDRQHWMATWTFRISRSLRLNLAIKYNVYDDLWGPVTYIVHACIIAFTYI